VYIDGLPIGAELIVETGHTIYRLENRGHGKALIQGHPKYCPKPVLAEVLGSSRGGAILKLGYICEGFRMDFVHPELGAISTSRVVSVHPPSVS
jgi:hypothetical protein